MIHQHVQKYKGRTHCITVSQWHKWTLLKQELFRPGSSLYISFIAILKPHLCSRCGNRVNQGVQMGQELFYYRTWLWTCYFHWISSKIMYYFSLKKEWDLLFNFNLMKGNLAENNLVNEPAEVCPYFFEQKCFRVWITTKRISIHIFF